MIVSPSSTVDKGKKMLTELIDPTVISDKQLPLYDDVKSFKEITFQSDSDEDFTDGKRLTSLVRESYLKHLRLVLKQNYQVWCEKCKNLNDSSENNNMKYISDIDNEKCVKYLEQKALRSCMVAILYQKAMVHLISEIKQKTKEMKLYDNLNNIEKLNVFTSDKFIQTDDLIIKCDIESQTVYNSNIINNPNKQFRSVSLLDLPLPDPKDVLQSLGSDFIDKNNPSDNNILIKTNTLKSFNNDIHHTKETIAKVQPQPRKPLNCKYLNNSSRNNKEVKQDFAPESKRRKLNCFNNDMDNKSIDGNSKQMIINNLDLINMLTDNNNCKNLSNDEIINSNNNYNNKTINLDNNILLSSSSQDVIDNELLSIENNVNNKSINDNEISKNNIISLDDRIAELGYLINEEESCSSIYNNNTNNNKVKKSNDIASTTTCNSLKVRRSTWFIEMTAHYCNFAKVFLSLDDNKKIKVKERLNSIFGCDNNSDCDFSFGDMDDNNYDNISLNESNLSICRKRTANMVVAELTPYFEAKKIKSRLLFKEFAKRVTNSIMSRTYASDSRAVNQFITEYFSEKDCIKSLEDLDF